MKLPITYPLSYITETDHLRATSGRRQIGSVETTQLAGWIGWAGRVAMLRFFSDIFVRVICPCMAMGFFFTHLLIARSLKYPAWPNPPTSLVLHVVSLGYTCSMLMAIILHALECIFFKPSLV